MKYSWETETADVFSILYMHIDTLLKKSTQTSKNVFNLISSLKHFCFSDKFSDF